MKKINAIIIEDENDLREVLESLLRKHCPIIRLCGSAGSAEEGRELLERYRVDIIFLDIIMPNEDGFSFLESIPIKDYIIIFTSAHEEYALKALKINAIDFLQKPINMKDLKEAVTKAVHFLNLRNGHLNFQEVYYESLKNLQENIRYEEKPFTRITIPEQSGFKIISISDLMYLIADRNYTELYLSGGKKIVSTKCLTEFEKLLDDNKFYRIHKSALVNVHYMQGFSSQDGNIIVLSDGKNLEISRRKILDFREWVKHSTL